MKSIPRSDISRIENIVADRLADWPPQWEGFHWPGYTHEHTYRVRNLALALGEREGGDPAVIEPAALLHDICKAQGRDHARIGAEEAASFLGELRVEPELRERIVEAIALHSGENTHEHPVENRVLGDADLIDANFGYVATWRFITIRAGRSSSLDDTVAGMIEWLPKKDELQALLLTEGGREVAAERSRAMHAFCADIAAAFNGHATCPRLRTLIEYVAGDYGRASLSAQLERLSDLADGDVQAEAVCRRFADEIAGIQ